MITIRLNGENPVSTRFAISPSWEAMTSYSLLTLHSEQFPLYYEWVAEVKKATDGIELPYLNVLFRCLRFFPDFLTPPTTKPIMNIYEEIDGIRNTPYEIICRDLNYLIEKAVYLSPQDEKLLQEYFEQPERSLERLTEEILLYWRLTLAHHWTRMQEILEADIMYRAKQLALGGAETVFSDIDPTVSYQNFEVHLAKKHDYHLVVEKDRIVLIPLIFSCYSPFTVTAPEWYPTMSYQPRGWGMWRATELIPGNDALELTLGAGRAKLLQSLSSPASTGELAHRLNVTAGAVSQQLARLTQAGLVTSMQNGKRVYHQLTQRGEMLLQLFE